MLFIKIRGIVGGIGKLLVYFAIVVMLLWFPAYIISTITPRPPQQSSYFSTAANIVICEQNNDIRTRNNLVRLLDYIALDLPSILYDIGTSRPYLPYYENCFDGIPSEQEYEIRNSKIYQEWITMRMIESAKFLEHSL